MTARTLPWDWYDGVVPANVALDDEAYLETSYSFLKYRSEAPEGVRIGRGASVYLGVMFDMGPSGRVSIGEFTLMNGARIICDAEVEIGPHCLISWNVVLMDTYRLSPHPAERRRELERMALHPSRELSSRSEARPVRIGSNVWIGFNACLLPGVSVGEGSVIGAKSVVLDDVPPYCVAAGNPARVIRRLEPEEGSHAAHR